MIQNYLKIAFRNLRKNRLYSFLNIFGLSLGIAACLLIVLYVAHELSYDRWNPNADRIVRLAADINFGGNHFELAVVGSVAGPDAAKELPEVQAFCRFRDYGTYLVRKEGLSQQNIREEHVLTVDSSFFEVFPLKVLEGDPARCLTRPDVVAISRSRAEKYFSSPQMALGQTLVFENKDRKQVTAVFEDMPVNTHFRADILISMNGNNEVKTDPPFWASNNNFQTYLLLHKGVDPAAFRKKFETLSKSKISITAQQMLGTTIEEVEKTGQYARYYLQNLTDIHLRSNLTVELAPNGNIAYVWIFSAIAAFILLIACINFMNLSTAKASVRQREIGIKKAIGSPRRTLVMQFLSEAVLLSTLSTLLALVLAAVLLPYFNGLTGKQITLHFSPNVIAGAGGVALLTGLLSGSYPAVFLSGFRPAAVLKGRLQRSWRELFARRGLVVFQFAVSLVLIFAVLVIQRQVRYVQSRNLGYDKSNVLYFDKVGATMQGQEAFLSEVRRIPGVESASAISGNIVQKSNMGNGTTYGIDWPGKTDKDLVNFNIRAVDFDLIETLGIGVKEGRSFSRAFSGEGSMLLLNETAVRAMGLKNPVGQKVVLWNQPRTIAGVVRDFHVTSLREPIAPMAFRFDPKETSVFMVRVKAGEQKAALDRLAGLYKKFNPGYDFDFKFLDQAYQAQYVSERRVARLSGYFAGLAILISCLGLLGLSMFTVEQRTKEIGIRKVLGASATGITGLLATDFLKLVAAAFVIAFPVAYYLMQKWLAGFAFRIDIQWWMFVAAGLAALAVAFFTVGFQSMKAALANPLKSLRNE